MVAAHQPASASLPELRQELQLHAGPLGGRDQSWLIYDPVRHRYFEVSRRAFDLLERWTVEPIAAFAASASIDLERPVSADDVAALVTFVVANHLALSPPKGDARMLAQQDTRGQRSLLLQLVHNYLFFKVPLVRPERFLKATLPLIEPLFSRTAGVAVILLWLVGLYFASRQWDLFVATFLDLLSLEGAIAYGGALFVVKALHELGHAYTATRFGVRVNCMGVAFMVLTPILYTDVSDAWRLQHRREKLLIDGAGIVTELALAGIAIFLWAFLPDGPMRSIAFVTATTSVVMGLVVNLNPLMRFDGYHLLADAWRVPNLQARSNALARWWLREFLFDLQIGPPEPFPRWQFNLLVVYAVCIWIYRLVLFLGIAILVYFMFFKVLGIVLFVIEIAWFILLPIAGECKEWWNMRAAIVKTRRSLISGVVAAAGLAALFVPWSGTVKMQGVALSGIESTIFAPRPARVVSIGVADQMPVIAGQILLVLEAPDLNHDIRQARQQITLVRLRLARIAGDDVELSNLAVLQTELARHQTNLRGLDDELQKLVMRAPHGGTVRDLDRDLQPAEWIDPLTPLTRVVSGGAAHAKGYVSEDDLWRLGAGAAATFVPEDPMMDRRHGRVIEVVQSGARAIEFPYLASIYGGAIATDRNADNEIKPRSGRHLVRIVLDGPAIDRVIRGTLHITGTPESIAAAMLRRILQVLVRESSA